MTERVLITDGDQRSALACLRSLGGAGHECYVLGPQNGALAGRSRYCHDSATCADPAKDPERFLRDLEEKLKEWRITALFPMTEKTLRLILPRRDQMEGILLPFPKARIFEAVSDKALVMKKASEVGIALPKQWIWQTPEDADPTAIPENCFPLAVKPTTSVSGEGRPRPNRGVEYISSCGELEGWKDEVDREEYPFLIQERIIGEGAGVFLLQWEGVLRGVMGHSRVREKPPSGGVSVVRDSTEVDPDLLERSLHLLDRLGWESGVAMVEFKIQRDSGIPFLMEINGRFWGSLQLAVDAGVDFPNLLLRAARNEDLGTPVAGTPGMRTRWLLGDVDQLLSLLFKRRGGLNLPPAYPGRLHSLLRFLGDFRPGVRLEVLRPSDLKPFIWEVRQWFRDLV